MELYVNEHFDSRTIDVWLVDPMNGTDCFYTTHSEDPAIQGVFRHESDTYIRSGTTDQSGKVKPFMKISDRLFKEFLRLMVDYASKHQLKTENENLLTGKLVATEKHLADMRTIAFKVLDIADNTAALSPLG
jgi:hypothetical protein